MSLAALLLGAGAVGTFDLLDAFVFFGLRGVTPARILQSIAAGVLGRSAYQAGWPAAVLGLVLHFTIATVIVLVYYAASRRFTRLVRRPLLFGGVYGAAVYFTMSELVVPLSAAGAAPFSLPVFVNGLLIHVFGVGMPAALAARGSGVPQT